MYRWQGCDWRSADNRSACAFPVGHIGWHERHIRPDSADHPDRLTEAQRAQAIGLAQDRIRAQRHRAAFLGHCGQASCKACG